MGIHTDPHKRAVPLPLTLPLTSLLLLPRSCGFAGVASAGPVDAAVPPAHAAHRRAGRADGGQVVQQRAHGAAQAVRVCRRRAGRRRRGGRAAPKPQVGAQ